MELEIKLESRQTTPSRATMSPRSRLALGIVVVALPMGVLGDALLRETPWGLNALVWTAAVVAAVLTLMRRQGIRVGAGGRILAVTIFAFAALLAWRDSSTLKFLDGLGVAVALSLAAFRAKRGRLMLAGITEYIEGLFIAAFNATLGPILLLLADVQWSEIPAENRPRHLAAAARGLLIAIPLLVVFGGLFMAADAVFEVTVKNALTFDLQRLALHGFVIAACAWSVGGSLRAFLLEQSARPVSDLPESSTVVSRAKRSSIGIVEIGTALGLINLLFFCFVAVQFKYFFGGTNTVVATTGLSYAEYARRGFFELVTVAVLVLLLLLGAHWLLRNRDPKDERVFRGLAASLLLLLFVVMISAVQRMRLYQIEYGLTELRLYTTAFMGWLAIVFVWFAATVLRGQRQRFAFGALVAGAAMIVALHLFNPDRLIVTVNANRAASGRGFDAPYATSLSADAVPALVEALPSLSPKERCLVAALVLERWSPLGDADWRGSSRSRRQAWQAIQENNAMLTRAAGCRESTTPPTGVAASEVIK